MNSRLISCSAMALLLSSSAALAGSHSCAEGKTLTNGTLTIATSNPAYFPWVLDNDPASGNGFEAAVAYAVADKMGFGRDNVTWVAASFDQSIQPGAKNFDFNLQQFSITEDREKVVDFSMPYYSAAAAVLATGETEAGDKAALQGLKWGAAAGTTAPQLIEALIEPSSSLLLYNDSADVVEAMKAGQIDASLFDLPTALYLGAVVLDGGQVLGQFPAELSENPDQFGLLMEEGNALKECVDAAIEALSSDGTLAALEAQWLQETTGVPVIE